MLGFIVALGGLVGGVLAALLSNIATGMELGLLLAVNGKMSTHRVPVVWREIRLHTRDRGADQDEL